MLDIKFLKYRPSLVAASVIYLVNKIKKVEIAWPDVAIAASGYEEKQLRQCAKDLCLML
jgi:hypothetical protein